VAANPFHTGTAGRAVTHGIFFSEPITAAALADDQGIRCLVLDDFFANGYAARYAREGNCALGQSLWAQLYYAGRHDCGWRRYATITDGGMTIQIWVRDGWPTRFAAPVLSLWYNSSNADAPPQRSCDATAGWRGAARLPARMIAKGVCHD